jgi:hypothetical protein
MEIKDKFITVLTNQAMETYEAMEVKNHAV